MLFELVRCLLGGEIELAREYLIELLMWIPIIIFSLSFHEMAHAVISNKLGDPTANYEGRITLNPLKHLDPIGALAMLIIGFGWAKPVPVNTRNFEKPRRDMALSSLAGPVSNLILAIASVIVCGGLNVAAWLTSSETTYDVLYYVFKFFYFAAYLNISLAIFNFIPVPPLDGSRILGLLVPAKYYYNFVKYERYIGLGFMVLVLVLSYGFNVSLISWITDPITNGLLKLAGIDRYFGVFTYLSH